MMKLSSDQSAAMALALLNARASLIAIPPFTESDPELGSDEIIELTDVVGEGNDPLEADSAKVATSQLRQSSYDGRAAGSDADAPLLLDEEEPDHDPIRLPEDITAEGLEPPSFAEEKTDPVVVSSATLAESAGMKEAFPGDDFSAMESSDFKFENSSPFEAADTEPFPEKSQENLDNVLAGLEKDASVFEKPEDILADLEKNEPDAEEHQIEQAEEFSSGYEEPDEDEKPIDVPAGLDGNDKAHPAVVATLAESAEKSEETAATHDIPGISEEKMKELLTEVIQETVDKAVRETVSEVAEKVIREAIDALKQSIASSDS